MSPEVKSLAATAQRRTDEQVDRIFAALDALRAAFAGGGVPARTGFEAHVMVACASGSPLFAEILETPNESIQRIMAAALGITHAGSQDRARRVFDEHEAIAEAIRQGDPEAATLTMRYHPHCTHRRLTDGQRDLWTFEAASELPQAAFQHALMMLDPQPEHASDQPLGARAGDRAAVGGSEMEGHDSAPGEGGIETPSFFVSAWQKHGLVHAAQLSHI